MAALRRFLRRLANAIRPDRAEASLDREIASHLLLLEDDYRRRGMSAAEAQLAARKALGGIDRAKELHRDARSFVWLDELRRDLRYAARRLAGQPGSALAIVLTIGVAIGGTGAVFSLTSAVLLEPLPYRKPAELVVIWEGKPGSGTAPHEVAPVNYQLLRTNNQVLASVAAVAGLSATLNAGGGPEKVAGRRVTHDFFDVLGIAPALGRGFRADEDRPGAARVVVVTHAFWRDRLGGDPGVLGREIVLDGDSFSVVGVMPAGFQFLGADVALWTPAGFSPGELARGANYLTIVARLAPGVTVAGAQSNLDHAAARLAPVLPATADGFHLNVVSLHDEVAGNARRPLVILLGAVGLVMLIACANVASLLMARGATRRHEMALRRSLGATRIRLVRQLMTESFVLCGLGLVTGVVLARGALQLLTPLVPSSMFLFAQPALDVRTLACTSLVAVLAGVLFGLAPALHVTRFGLGSALKGSGRVLAGPDSRRGALVVIEVAMTLVLLVVAGLLIQTLYRLRYADIGFQPAQVLSLRTALPSEAYASHHQRVAFYDRVIERVSHLPGVAAVGYSTSVPLAWKGATTGLLVEGRAPQPGTNNDANHRQVSAAYLQTIGVPLMEGRYFTDGDRAGAPAVVIVNRTLARLSWPDASAIGRRFRTTDDGGSSWLTVVGVVGDVRQMGLDLPPRPEMYVPYRQFDSQPWFAPRDLVVRASGDPTPLTAAVVAQVHAVDPALPVTKIRLLDDLLDEEVASRRLGTVVLVAFAAFALLLAVIGIYSVISYFVVQHTSEIGVRVALGAQPGDILALVAGKGITLTAIGVAVGAAGALVATRLVSSLLHGVSELDPTTLLLAAAFLMAVAALASYLPARRATRLDAVVAIRQE